MFVLHEAAFWRGSGVRPKRGLSDVDQPRDGFAETLAALPVVAMSASGAHLSQAAMVGANATLVKPFDLDTLLDTIARYCAPHPD